MFGLIPLPAAWPVYVSHAEASAYARWRGGRLPTEAEYQRAAYGSPEDTARAFPWGDAPPDPSRGVFDFAGWDPQPVGTHPAGRSAWGVHDLVGNGWEWTSSIFRPFPGFEAERIVSRVLGGLLRRVALRDEGRVAGDGARTAAALVPQLVPPALSLRLRSVSLRG